MSRSTCIPLYPATDGRQTGDSRRYKKHVDGDKWIQVVFGNMYPGVNAALDSVSVDVSELDVVGLW